MSTRVLTRAQYRNLLAEIEFKNDPNEVTFKPKNELTPVWLAVLRYRYVTDMPAKGYTTIWEDFAQELGTSHLEPLQLAYDDTGIKVRPLHPDLYVSKIRASLQGVPRLTVHIYPATKKRKQFNILVQGKDCRNWIVNDFQRLQQVVVRMFIQQLSKARMMKAWSEVDPTLTLPPPFGEDESEESFAALTYLDVSDGEGSLVPLSHPEQRDKHRSRAKQRSESLSHREVHTPP
jgi:hypothetical protein